MMKESFLTCQLDLESYLEIGSKFFKSIFDEKVIKFFKIFQGVNTEEKLRDLLKFWKDDFLLRCLAAGIKVSERLTFKPNLDTEVVKSLFSQQGLNFDLFNYPLPIELFFFEHL